MSKGFTHESTANESKEWYTPATIFEALGIEFDLDPCSPGKAICPWVPTKKTISLPDNGLTAAWEGKVWMNPPYGQDTPAWMQRLQQHGNGIALVFARTDTKWFHDYVVHADAICFIKGRVQFVPAIMATAYAQGQKVQTGGCGAASMLVAYGQEMGIALMRSDLGLVVLPSGRL